VLPVIVLALERLASKTKRLPMVLPPHSPMSLGTEAALASTSTFSVTVVLQTTSAPELNGSAAAAAGGREVSVSRRASRYGLTVPAGG